MVDVRVAENDVRQARRVKRKRLAIALVSLAPALDETAIEQDTCVAGINEVARTGDLARRAMKRDLHGAYSTRRNHIPARSIR